MSLLSGKKLLIIQAAALSYEISRDFNLGLEFHPGESVFPALTCTVQASFRTATRPAAHGMVANGRYDRVLRKPMFWEQSSALVAGPRIWQDFRDRGGKVAMMFWQQSMGEQVDILLTPAPIHKHNGGMIDDCYSQPDDFYHGLRNRIGRAFRLHRYWGPMADAVVGDWITAAARETMADPDLAPDLFFTYLPSLDYDFQRFGPRHERSRKACTVLHRQLDRLLTCSREHGYETVIFGDYAIAPCAGPAVFPNRFLLESGFMKTRTVRGRLYPDFHLSTAFAMTDHEIAHVYVADNADIDSVRTALLTVEGIESVFDKSSLTGLGLDHESGGELVALARPGRWFAYPWWPERHQAPDYAGHVDIHNKPGFDPCELYFSLLPPGIGQDTRRIGGTHGRIGEGREIAIAATVSSLAGAGSVTELARQVKGWLAD